MINIEFIKAGVKVRCTKGEIGWFTKGKVYCLDENCHLKDDAGTVFGIANVKRLLTERVLEIDFTLATDSFELEE